MHCKSCMRQFLIQLLKILFLFVFYSGPAWGCRQLCKALGVTMEVRGLENIRKDNGSVVLMNHQSALDLLGEFEIFIISNDLYLIFLVFVFVYFIVLAYLWPIIGRATVVSKREVLYLPFFGFGSWLWGTLFINRSRKTDSINALQKESKAINERGCKLLLFPEGTRNSRDTLLPFKKGSFHIALQSQCPIQPVVISKYWFLNSEEKIFRPGHAIIHILPEIPTAGCTKDDMDGLIEKTRNIMQSEYTKLSQEAKVINSKKQN